MLDNKLYQTSFYVQKLELPDGSSVDVKKYEIRTLLTQREVIPLFERPCRMGEKARKTVLPFFAYDPETQTIVGEEPEKTTLDERMIEIVNLIRSEPAEGLENTPGAYVHFHFFFSGSEAHAMAYLPNFEEIPWYFMVRAEIVPVTNPCQR